MKKLLKMIAMVLTLSLFLAIPVSATNMNGGGNEGNGDGGQTSTGTSDMTGKDGATPAKTGYLIYGSDASGNANTPIVFVTTFGIAPYSTSGASLDLSGLRTRFGASFNSIDESPIEWGIPPFGTSGTGAGGYIKAWLMTPHGNALGFEWVLMNYLGMSEEQVLAYEQEENYVNVEAVMWGGVYSGTSHSGRVLVGTAKPWAEATDSGNYLSRYTHANLPNSLHYEEPWLGLAVPSDTSNKHSSGEITANVGYGIVSVRVKPGDRQIVKVYKTAGQVDGTSYGTCSEEVAVKDEGSYKVTKWDTGKKKTEIRDTKADYPAVTGGIPLVQGGGEPADVHLDTAEKAISILLEREVEPPTERNADVIRSHELNFVFPKMSNTREGFNFEPVNFILSDVLSQYERTGDNIKNWSTDEEYEVVEERDGDIVSLNGGLLHRYNSDAGFYKPWN